jgi:rhamnose utilization protein RhaD (predicted bifunctional aldolase and dehydrogenase)
MFTKAELVRIAEAMENLVGGGKEISEPDLEIKKKLIELYTEEVTKERDVIDRAIKEYREQTNKYYKKGRRSEKEKRKERQLGSNS